jgi:hypothetical protein
MVMINTFLYLYDEINKTVIMSKIDTFLIDESCVCQIEIANNLYLMKHQSEAILIVWHWVLT